jgi:DNA-binding NarL/FixJ family response regulator
MFIDGLKALLNFSDDIKVVGESLSGKQCIEELHEKQVDVLITDISMPEMKGDELAKNVTNLFPSIKILALSMHHDIMYINKMIQAGAIGYVLKNTGAEELEEAIRLVYQGKTYYSPQVKEAIIRGYSKEKSKTFKVMDEDRQLILTPREKEVIQLVIKGFSSSEVAEQLDLSYHTITSHRKNLNAKLGTSSITEIERILRENNII